MKPVYLYVKQHDVTGMLYFGKTVRNDVDMYMGSGVVWTRHIKKHGKTHVKTLWVSEPFNNRDDLVEFALFFSKEFNIVESKEWANLVEENGLAGGLTRVGAVLTEETKEKIRQKALGRVQSQETKDKRAARLKGHVQTEKQKQAMRDYNSSRNLPQLLCPHCNKLGSYVAMHRWHFDNCKNKEI